jgi:hypothetical protein
MRPSAPSLLLLSLLATACAGQTAEQRDAAADARRDVGADAYSDFGRADQASIDTRHGDPEAGVPKPIDTRPYWARAGLLQTYRRWDGSIYGRYRFTERASGPLFDLYQQFYKQVHPGALVSWEKQYPAEGGGYCTPTYGLLWLGDDASVTEVGDWWAKGGCKPDRAFGYRSFDGTQNLGLTWSPPGGLTAVLSPDVEVRVYAQATPGAYYLDTDWDAFSSVVLRKSHASWTAPYGTDASGKWVAGAGATYSDVLQLVLYHGRRSKELREGLVAPTRCTAQLDPAYPRAALYRPFKTYNTYAIELYLARGIGIVAEVLLFNETDHWGKENICKGAIMGQDHATMERIWSSTLDPKTLE